VNAGFTGSPGREAYTAHITISGIVMIAECVSHALIECFEKSLSCALSCCSCCVPPSLPWGFLRHWGDVVFVNTIRPKRAQRTAKLSCTGVTHSLTPHTPLPIFEVCAPARVRCDHAVSCLRAGLVRGRGARCRARTRKRGSVKPRSLFSLEFVAARRRAGTKNPGPV
jgi:hypothetical protein